MRAAVGLVLGVAMLTAANAAPLAEGDGESGLCDGIAAAVRANPGPMPAEKFDDPFKGATPWLTPAKPELQRAQLSDPSDQQEEFAAIFARRYKPDAALREKLKDFYADHPEESSVGPVHLLTETGGSASCQGFLLFETTKAGTTALPDIPPGSSDYCGGNGGQGELIAIHGQPAFLETQTDYSNYRYTLGIAMLRPDHWAPACRIQVRFRHDYAVSETIMAPGSSVPRAELETAALRRAPIEVRGNYNPIVSGLTPEQRGQLAEMTGLALTGDFRSGNSGTGNFRDGDYGPLLLGGVLYWGVLRVDGIGWRPSPDRAFTLYALANGSLKEAATVKLTGTRGKLSDIRVFRGVW